MKNIIILFLLFSTLNSFSQHTLLHENVEGYTYFNKKNFGVNNPHYIYQSYRFGFTTPSINALNYDLNYVRSTLLGYSITYKIKFFNWFAFGINANYNMSNYSLKKHFYYSYTEGQTEKILLHNVGSEAFLRFNIGKHGNTMGKYIDLGGFVGYNFYNQYIIKVNNEIDNNAPFSSKKLKLVFKNMNIFEPLQYGAMTRIGFNMISFVFKYRISSLLTQEAKDLTSSYELPNFSVAVEISIFQ